MPEKKTMSLAAAAAVAWVKDQPSYAGAWGVGEHLALTRRMAIDALEPAQKMVGQPVMRDGKPLVKDGKPVVHDLKSALNTVLKAAHAADPELAYASNFQKLLVKCGEIQAGSEYE